MFQIQSILSRLLKRTTGIPEVNLVKVPFVGTLISDMQEEPMREVLKQFPKESLQQIIKIANEELKKK
jgi:hypothetical protein